MASDPGCFKLENLKASSEWDALDLTLRNGVAAIDGETEGKPLVVKMNEIMVKAKGIRRTRRNHDDPTVISIDDWHKMFQQIHASGNVKNNLLTAYEVQEVKTYSVRLAITKPEIFGTYFVKDDDGHRIWENRDFELWKPWCAAHLYFGSPWKKRPSQYNFDPQKPPTIFYNRYYNRKDKWFDPVTPLVTEMDRNRSSVAAMQILKSNFLPGDQTKGYTSLDWKLLFQAICDDGTDNPRRQEVENKLSEEDLNFLKTFMWDMVHTHPSHFTNEYAASDNPRHAFLQRNDLTTQWIGGYLLYGCPSAQKEIMDERTGKPWEIVPIETSDLLHSDQMKKATAEVTGFPFTLLPRVSPFNPDNREHTEAALSLRKQLTAHLGKNPMSQHYKEFFHAIASDNDVASDSYPDMLGTTDKLEDWRVYLACMAWTPPGVFGANYFVMKQDSPTTTNANSEGLLKVNTLTKQWMGAHMAVGDPWRLNHRIDASGTVVAPCHPIEDLVLPPTEVWNEVWKDYGHLAEGIGPLKPCDATNDWIGRVFKTIAPNGNKSSVSLFRSFFSRAFTDPCPLTVVRGTALKELQKLALCLAKSKPQDLFGSHVFAVHPSNPHIAILALEGDIPVAAMWLAAHSLFGSPWHSITSNDEECPQTSSKGGNDDSDANPKDDDTVSDDDNSQASSKGDDDKEATPDFSEPPDVVNTDKFSYQITCEGNPTQQWFQLLACDDGKRKDLPAYSLSDPSHAKKVQEACDIYLQAFPMRGPNSALQIGPLQWKNIFEEITESSTLHNIVVAKDLEVLRDIAVMLGKCQPRAFKKLYTPSVDGMLGELNCNSILTKIWTGAHLAFGNSFGACEDSETLFNKAAKAMDQQGNNGNENFDEEVQYSPFDDNTLNPQVNEIAESICSLFAPKASHASKVFGAGKVGAFLLEKENKLEYLMPRSQAEVKAYNWVSEEYEFPEVSVLRGPEGDRLKEGWNAIANRRNQKMERAIMELLPQGETLQVGCFEVFQKHFRKCREVYSEFRMMNPLLDRPTVEKLIIGTFRHKEGSTESAFDHTRRQAKHKFVKAKKKDLGESKHTRNSAVHDSETESADEDAADESNSTQNTRSKRKVADVEAHIVHSDDENDDKAQAEAKEVDESVASEGEVENDDDDDDDDEAYEEDEGATRQASNATSSKKKRKQRKGRVTMPPKKKTKKDLHPNLTSILAPALLPPVRKSKKEREKAQDGQFYNKPGRTWIKSMQQTLRLIKNFLNSLGADEGIKPTRGKWTAMVETFFEGSENGGNHNERAFVWVIAAVLFIDIKGDSDCDENVDAILIGLNDKGLLKIDQMADADIKTIQEVVEGVKENYGFEWMQAAAKNIQSKHHGIVPSSRDELLALTDTMTEASASLVLQQAFGFSALPVIDNDCRKVMVALGMADLTEFLNKKGRLELGKATTDKLQKSLKTWLPLDEYSSFHCTLKGFAQVVCMHQTISVRKEHAKILKRAYNKFPEDQQTDLWELIHLVATQFKNVKGAKQVLTQFPSPYEEDEK